MAGQRREVAQLMRTLAREHGFDVRITGAGHWQMRKDGKRLGCSQSPNDARAVKNIKGDIYRTFGIRI